MEISNEIKVTLSLTEIKAVCKLIGNTSTNKRKKLGLTEDEDSCVADIYAGLRDLLYGGFPHA